MRSQSTFTICVAALLIGQLLLAACSTPTPAERSASDSQQLDSAEQESDESSQAESRPSADRGAIRIGALVPLSAPGSVVGGEAMRDAMIIAADEINSNGGLLGQPVELVVVDSEGLPERGAAASERLINQEGVVAIAGGYHSSVGVVAKEVAHDNNIPVVFANTSGRLHLNWVRTSKCSRILFQVGVRHREMYERWHVDGEFNLSRRLRA